MSSPENPFGAPQRAHQPASEFRAGPTVPYASANGRARAANLLIIACGLTFVLMIVSTWLQIQLLEKARNGVRPTIEQATANDNRQVIVAGIYLLVFLVSVVTFCIWKHRVHRNLRSLGARHLKYSPGWAVGSYFIPILNLFRPYQVMNEINYNSLPSTTDGNKFGGVRATLAPVGAWWALWILFNLSSNFAGRMPV